MCRKKGRVVLVGDVGLHLNRADFYEKELDFFISTSYGPGRYDRTYEEEGLDYPIGYVRWTENRNMGAYLRLLADGRMDIGPLLSGIYPVEEAPSAYAALDRKEDRPLLVLLSYPHQCVNGPVSSRVVSNPGSLPSREGRIRIALAGAGGFAKGMHLPNLRTLGDHFHLRAVMSRTGHNAMATARQFGAGYATTDYRAILDDSEVDAVLVCTRHDLHASMTLDALRAGKHVLVEKPLALNEEELAAIEAFYSETAGRPAPVLLTGFNRRFSPHARRIRQLIEDRQNPMILNYRMNAGYFPPSTWVHTSEGGGRNIGEACHIYDLFTFLTGSRATWVSARSIAPVSGYYSHRDNFIATVDFEDGSVATLTYTSLGSTDHPKEQLEVYAEGKVLSLTDYRRLAIAGGEHGSGLETSGMEKGHREELEAFAKAISTASEWPIPLWQQLQSMKIAFEVERYLDGFQSVKGGMD